MGNIIKKKVKTQQPQELSKYRVIVPNILVPEAVTEKEHPNRKFCSNKIETTKYNFFSFLPKNLFEQFHRVANLYFLFIVLLNWVPQVNALGKEVVMLPVLFVLAVTGVKDAFEDYRRYRSDKRINHLKCRVYEKSSEKYVLTDWESVKVGDFVHISCNEVIPADILLLKSSDQQNLCYIETSNLDGESNLKERQVVKKLYGDDESFSPGEFTYNVECEYPRKDINHFHGNILKEEGQKISLDKENILLRGCVLRNTDFVEGLVIYAGHESKALLNNRGPRYKQSQLERRMNRDVVMCMLVLCVMCFFCAIGSGIWLDHFPSGTRIQFLPHNQSDDWSPAYQAFIVFWTYLILYQVVIPVSLYVTIEIVKLGQVYFITHDKELYYEETNTRVQCRALNITEDLGQVEFIFSDKTGTLTENKMEFRCCSIGGVNYPHIPGTNANGAPPTDPEESDSSLYSSQSSVCYFTPEPKLLNDVAKMSVASLSGHDAAVPAHRRKIHEFFLVLAICNTVMVTTQGHHDKINEDSLTSSREPLLQTTGQVPSGVTSTVPPVKHKGILKPVHPSVQHKDASNPPVSTPHSTLHKTHHVLLGNKGVAPLDVPSQHSSVTGVPVTKTATEEVKSEIFEGVYEAESPDELALVRAAAKYGCRLLQRNSNQVTVWLPGEGQVRFDLLHVLRFDPERKLMSVIVRCPLTGDIVLYCKGADSCVLNKLQDTDPSVPTSDTFDENSCDDAWIIDRTKDHLTDYAKRGMRTLCMAKRVFSFSEYSSWLTQRHLAETTKENREKLLLESCVTAERKMQLLGVTGVEDRLQDGVSETIQDLQKAGITIWVLTGDKEETAVNVAYACGLISFDQELLTISANSKESTENVLTMSLSSVKQRSLQKQICTVTTSIHDSTWTPKVNTAMLIDGKALGFAMDKNNQAKFIDLVQHCSSVICCRTSPHQKAMVVKMVQDKLKKLSLSIGDGANDVSMIQTADIGVGISGQEGMQAVMASDFAIARFHHLKRLLLVHGHWSYYRLALMTLYMFYKNSVYVLMIFWYQIYNGFSGSYMMDQINLLIFNTIYTSLPPLIVGMFDQNIDDETLMNKPKLYRESQKSQLYRQHSYWVNILDAIYQSLIMYFIPHFTYLDQDVSMLEFGTICVIGSVTTCLIHLGIETRSLMWPHWLCGILSFGFLWGFNILFDFFCVACIHPDCTYMVIQNAMVKPNFWLVIILVIVVGLLPRYVLRALQGSLRPMPTQAARQEQRYSDDELSTALYATWSSSSSGGDSVVQVSVPNGEEEASETALDPPVHRNIHYHGATPQQELLEDQITVIA